MNKKLTIIFSSIVLLGLASCTQDADTTSQVNIDSGNIAQEAGIETEVIAASAYNDFTSAPFAYREYNGQDLSNIGQQTVLFFAQESCGTCQKADADIKAQASLPDNVSVIKVDFDTETELNKQYGVTTKHTFVLIDEAGNEIAKEIGLATAQDIVAFVNDNIQAESATLETTNTIGAATLGTITSKATEVKEVAAETVEVVAEKAEIVKEVVVESTQEAVEEVIEETPLAASSAGTYKTYNGTVPGNSVLFFSAKWCPSCVAAEKNLAAEGDLAINADVIKVDFDTETALKAKYGVTTKHTFVLVDADGNLVKKMVTGQNSSDLQGLFN